MTETMHVKTRFTASEQVAAKLDKIAASSLKTTAKLREFGAAAQKSLDRASAGLGKIKSGFSAIAGPAAAATVSAGLVGKAVVGSGSDFEEAITAVGAVSLKTRDEIAALEAKALRLGESTKFTATQAANAMEVMSRAGFTEADILGGVGPVLSAAAAGGIEIAEASDIVSNALKGMGLATVDAETGANNVARVADVLTVASSKTNSSIGSLGESLKNVAGTASDLGIPLEETVASIALLQDTGLDASVAGSALNTMLTQLAAGNSAVSKLSKDANGNMRTLPEMLTALSSEMKKAGGNMNQVAMVADMVGLRGQKAASKLARLADAGKVDELTASLKDAEGAADRMAALKMDNLKGDFTLLESAIDGVKVAAFNAESGPMRGLVQATTEWVSANKDVIASKLAEWIGGLIKSLPEILRWVKRLAIAYAVFKGIEIAIGAANVAMALYNGVLALATVKTAGLKAATWLLRGGLLAATKQASAFAVAAAANPLTWIAAAVAGLIVLIFYWDKAIDSVTSYLRKAQIALGIGDVETAKKVDKAIASGKLLESDAAAAEQAKEEKEDKAKLDDELGGLADIFKRAEEISKGMGGEVPKGAEVPKGVLGTEAPEAPKKDFFAGLDGYSLTGALPGVTSPQEVKIQPFEGEVVIRDETGKAQVVKDPKASGGGNLRVERTGAP